MRRVLLEGRGANGRRKMVRSTNPAEGKDIVQVLYPSTYRFERYGAETFLLGVADGSSNI